MALLALPAGQREQVLLLVAPRAVDALPGGHARQTLALVAPMAVDHVPAGQGLQVEVLAKAAYRPAKHKLQLVARAPLNDPGAQDKHAPEPLLG